jgi:peptidoglycan/xylan/chitin deacetylase (PgdA/CDA1 family)
VSARSLRDLASLGYRRTQALAGAWSGATARRLDALRGRAAILMYHRVLPDAADVSGIEPGMYVRASSFERHLDWIERRWQIRTLGELVEAPPGADARPVVVLTFDDGWRDNLTVAWPILERRGLRATIFLVTGWVAAGRNGEGEFMRPDEVRELADRGIEFGAHTVTHPRLDEVGAELAGQELLVSRGRVAEWTARPCRLFAYPYGIESPHSVALARSAFRAAVAVGGGWWNRGSDAARLPRIGVHEDVASSAALLARRLACAG